MLWLLIGYMFLYIYRPFEVWPILGDIRIELIYMIGAGIYWLVVPQKRLALNSLTLAIALMTLALLTCSFLSPWSEECLNGIDSWLKFLLFFMMLITVVHDERSLKVLVVALLVIMSVYMLHSTYEFLCGRYVSRMGISRMVGIEGTNGDPNAFAMTIVLSLIFVPTCWGCFPNQLPRAFLTGYLLLGTFCISMTGSRAAFVALVIFVLYAVWKSAWRGRLAALLVPTAPLLFVALPAELQNRFETIVNPDVGPKNAQVSAEGRIDGFLIGMRLWQENPLFGVGPAAWMKATGRKINAHNLYGQVAGETGTLGVFALGFLMCAYIVNVRRIRQQCPRDLDEAKADFLREMASSITLGVAFLLFFGIFGHNLLRSQWVLYAALLVIVRQCVEQRAQDILAGVENADPELDAAVVPQVYGAV